MGVDASLEDEEGKPLAEVQDSAGLFVRLVAEARDAGPVCLRFIDPWGDTTFNKYQMAALIPELETAVAMVADESVREHGLAVMHLARLCQEGVHLYLKFVGD